jgi:hypothetical protein
VAKRSILFLYIKYYIPCVQKNEERIRKTKNIYNTTLHEHFFFMAAVYKMKVQDLRTRNEKSQK